MNRRLRICLNLFLVLIAAAGLTMLLHRQLEYRQIAADQAGAAEAAGLALSGPSAPEEAADLSETADEPSVPAPDPLPEEAASLAALDLAALREVNPDVAGWLFLPGAGVSHPILQGEDNDYYLKHSWRREWSSGGAIFLDRRCSRGFDGFHTIIYGHRMNNGSMFGSLHKYEDPDFWRENPSVYVATDDAVYRYDIFAIWEPSITSAVYGPAPETEEDRRDFAAMCRSSSLIDTGLEPGPEDKLLTLSTCTGRGHDTRWVVQSLLARTYDLSRSGREEAWP